MHERYELEWKNLVESLDDSSDVPTVEYHKAMQEMIDELQSRLDAALAFHEACAEEDA